MNLQEIRVLAKDYGIKISGLNKMKLIQTIQLTEGNFDCFASAKNAQCDQMNASGVMTVSLPLRKHPVSHVL